MLLLPLQQVEQTLHQIVDVEQLQLGGAVVDGVRLIVGHRPAEGGNGAVVVGAAVAHEVGEAVDVHRRARFPAVSEEQLLPRQLRAAIFAVAEAPGQRRLNGGREHDGRGISVPFQAVQQLGGQVHVACLEVLYPFRPVHPRQVEHKVRFGAVVLQLRWCGAVGILENFVDMDAGAGAVLAVPDGFQVVAEGRAHHALGAGDENVHVTSPTPPARPECRRGPRCGPWSPPRSGYGCCWN